MKRPLFLIGISLLVCELFLMKVGNFTVAVFSVFFSIVAFLVLWLIMTIRRKATFQKHGKLISIYLVAQIILASVCVSSVMYCAMDKFSTQKALEFVGEREISVTVTEYPTEKGERNYVIGKLNGNKIRLSLSKKKSDAFIEYVKPGDTIEFYGKVYKLGMGIKSVEDNFKSKRMYIGAYPYGDINYTENESKNPYYLLLKERENIKLRFLSYFGKSVAGVGISVVLGDKSQLDDEIYTAFKQTGSAHILAVSGMHLSVWILFLSKFFELLGISRRRSSFVLVMVVLFVMTLTGFTGSILRAGIMMIVYLFGYILRRKPDGLNSLGFSAIVMLMINPFSASGISFLMSFCATLGIFLLFRPLSVIFDEFIDERINNKGLRMLTKSVFSAFVISISASLFTAPIQVFTFNTFSLMSPFTNVLLYPFVFPLILCFGLFAFLYFVPIVGTSVAFFAEIITKIILFVINGISILPGINLNISEENYALFFICFGIIISFFLVAVKLLYKKHKFNKNYERT